MIELSRGRFVAAKYFVALILLSIGMLSCSLCQNTTNTYISQQYFNSPGSTAYYLIATLPASNAGTLDHLHMVATLNGDWYSSDNLTVDATFGNRGGFNYFYTVSGKSALGGHTHLVAYQQADASVNIYLGLADAFDSGSYAILNNLQETVYPSAVPTLNAIPPGTLVFDTASTSYPPITYTDSAGNLTTNGAITATSISFPGGSTMSSAPPANLSSSNGNMGIGTQSPTSFVEIDGGTDQTTTALSDAGSRLSNLALDAGDVSYGAGSAITFGNAQSVAAGSIGWAAIKAFLVDGRGNTYGDLAFSTRNSTSDTALTERLRIGGNGNIGIGTSTPGAMLDVSGNVRISGAGASMMFPDGTVQSTAYTGTCTATGGDYAESVDVTGSKTDYEPGDVMVIGSTNPSNFQKSTEPYSRRVAGIYSTKPGYVGRRQKTLLKEANSEVPMAMIGIVPTQVSAENGPVAPGDLLVSSSTEGYAMKGTDSTRMMGAVIGKAMGTVLQGKATIEMLVTLQ